MFSCQSEAESCGFQDSVWLASYTRISGDCGDLEPRLVMPTTAPAGCTQSVTFDDSCGVTVNRECRIDGYVLRSLHNLKQLGAGYEGKASVSLLRDEGSCSGLYSVELAAQ